MKRLVMLLAFVLVPAWAVASEEGPGVTADQAMERLQAGNQRFCDAKRETPHGDAARRSETVSKGQHPFVTVLACSDSRVPVEVLFDQGVGDVFVTRVAGNVCGPQVAGTIEYGAEHLKTPLLVVLGHSHCGAVTAAATGAEVHGNIPALVRQIRPAVERAQQEHPDQKGKDLVPAATKANVWQAIDMLYRNSPIIRKLTTEGKLKVVGATYDLESGKVEWLGEHPDKAKLTSYTGGPSETHHHRRIQTNKKVPVQQ